MNIFQPVSSFHMFDIDLVIIFVCFCILVYRSGNYNIISDWPVPSSDAQTQAQRNRTLLLMLSLLHHTDQSNHSGTSESCVTWSNTLASTQYIFILSSGTITYLYPPCLVQGGVYQFQLIDYYGVNGACMLFGCLSHCVAVGWGFGKL